MHAPGDGAKPGQQLGRAQYVTAERIEDPNLHVRMAIKLVHQRQLIAQGHVIDQQAHTHAAVRGTQQGVEKQAPGQVVVKQVILGIDAALRLFGQHDAGDKGIHA